MSRLSYTQDIVNTGHTKELKKERHILQQKTTFCPGSRSLFQSPPLFSSLRGRMNTTCAWTLMPRNTHTHTHTHTHTTPTHVAPHANTFKHSNTFNTVFRWLGAD
jgi:hypothetical protein